MINEDGKKVSRVFVVRGRGGSAEGAEHQPAKLENSFKIIYQPATRRKFPPKFEINCGKFLAASKMPFFHLSQRQRARKVEQHEIESNFHEDRQL